MLTLKIDMHSPDMLVTVFIFSSAKILIFMPSPKMTVFANFVMKISLNIIYSCVSRKFTLSEAAETK
jgi:hypothetical protein